MTPEEFLDELTRMNIEVLKFAFEKKGVAPDSHYIGKVGEEAGRHEQFCLLEGEKRSWIVLFMERGVASRVSQHSHIMDAARDFYLRVSGDKTHLAFREQWEQETEQAAG